jgi:ketosteroid isomerase-like protein
VTITGVPSDAEATEDLTRAVDTSTMTFDEVVARNLRVVEAHFHNENPDDVDKAIALYTDDVVWEGPVRGRVYTDHASVKAAYLDIFQTLQLNKSTTLRRFATEKFVFDDQVADVTVVGDKMPNLGFNVGDRLSMRLVHCFELRDGKIAREIAYEISRSFGGPRDHDDIPEGSVVVDYTAGH